MKKTVRYVAMDVHAETIAIAMVAPTLIPTQARDRVKTDRRDAGKLARYLRGGDLTAVWVADEASEALRDLLHALQLDHATRGSICPFCWTKYARGARS